MPAPETSRIPRFWSRMAASAIAVDLRTRLARSLGAVNQRLVEALVVERREHGAKSALLLPPMMHRPFL